MDKARKFVKAITRPTRSDLAPIRVKDTYRFEDMHEILNRYASLLWYLWYSMWLGYEGAGTSETRFILHWSISHLLHWICRIVPV